MKLSVKQGIKDSFPIAIGYFPIAMTFGILAKGAGVTFFQTLAFSFCVYAGASQFIAVNMIAMGVGVSQIVFATLLINFRHFLMSASVANRLGQIPFFTKPFLSFGVTDETFSVASFAEGDLTPQYFGVLELIAYLSWGIGSGAGYLVGGILPAIVQQSMGIGLYAMFIALLVPEIKKSHKALVLALIAGITNTGLKIGLGMPQGWSIVLAIVFVSALGVFIYGDEEEAKEADNNVLNGEVANHE